MGVINTLIQTSIDAIEETRDHFKADTTTRSVDDITIRPDGGDFVLACV